MKKNVIKNINEIRSIVSKMPRTINEAVFDEVGGYMNEADDIVDAEPKMVEPQKVWVVTTRCLHNRHSQKHLLKSQHQKHLRVLNQMHTCTSRGNAS